MTRILSIAALLAVAACGQTDQPPAPTNAAITAAPSAPAVKAVVPSLKGEWRLVTPATLDLTIGDGQAALSSGCLRRGYTFSQKGNQVTFASAPAGSTNCGRSPSVAEETAFAALTDVNLAVFDKDGRKVTLSGLSGMFTIERR